MKKFNLEIAKTMKPAGFWEGFYEISQIPHPTEHEQELAKHLMKRFAELGCQEIKQDKMGNIRCVLPASAGCENWPMITIQGHMDMVPNKAAESTHDFVKDPLELFIEDDLIKANKTTLGADDAIAMSTMFAILYDKELKHGPIEFLCTVQEETGLIGASNIEKNFAKGKYLLNVDHENYQEVIIGCVACYIQDIHSKFTRKPFNGHKVLKLTLNNLKSGHSGGEIHLKRINSIKMMFDLLYNIITGEHKHEVAIVNVAGGILKNAIPADFKLELAIKPDEYECIKSDMTKMLEDYRKEFKGYDADFKYEFESTEPTIDPIEISRSNEIITMYMAMVNALDVYDFDHGQAETSTNCGVIETTNDEIIAHAYARSLYASGAERITKMVQACATLGHSTAPVLDKIPPWSPVYKDNELLEAYKKAYKNVNGTDIKVSTCPGGLESAVLLDRNESLRGAICIGPNLHGCHSPQEEIVISAAEKFYKVVKEFLQNADKIK